MICERGYYLSYPTARGSMTYTYGPHDVYFACCVRKTHKRDLKNKFQVSFGGDSGIRSGVRDSTDFAYATQTTLRLSRLGGMTPHCGVNYGSNRRKQIMLPIRPFESNE